MHSLPKVSSLTKALSRNIERTNDLIYSFAQQLLSLVDLHIRGLLEKE